MFNVRDAPMMIHTDRNMSADVQKQNKECAFVGYKIY
jgi:hypothetical protein